MGAIFKVGIFMSPLQEMKDCRWKCILRESPAGNGRVNTYDFACSFTLIKIICCSKIWPFSISPAFTFIYSLQVIQI